MTEVVPADQLSSIVQRIERLEDEKRALSDDIKAVYAEAHGNGFDRKTIRKIVSLRKLSPEQREEEDALLDLYKAALGMLNDTPLGEAAIRRVSGHKPEDHKSAPPPPAENAPAEHQAAQVDVWAADDMNAARARGASDAASGLPVTANPFPARDPRRAAYDEAWCASAGSDGMEIPDFLRRSKPPKPAAVGASSDPRSDA